MRDALSTPALYAAIPHSTALKGQSEGVKPKAVVRSTVETARARLRPPRLRRGVCAESGTNLVEITIYNCAFVLLCMRLP